jgi:hypothetical protein
MNVVLVNGFRCLSGAREAVANYYRRGLRGENRRGAAQDFWRRFGHFRSDKKKKAT